MGKFDVVPAAEFDWLDEIPPKPAPAPRISVSAGRARRKAEKEGRTEAKKKAFTAPTVPEQELIAKMDAMIEAAPKELKPPKPRKPRKGKRSAELLMALRAMPFKQRLYLEAMRECGGFAADALRMLAARGLYVEKSTASRWQKNPVFQHALEMILKDSMSEAGVSYERVLHGTAHVLKKAMEPKPVLYRGEETGHYEIDAKTALKALEMLGKSKQTNVWTEDTGPKVTIEIVDLSGRPAEADVIEGEFTVDGDGE